MTRPEFLKVSVILTIIICILAASTIKEVRSKTMSTYKDIRKPGVAGSFYTADPKQLRAQIDDFLGRATDPIPSERIMALVSPHAGYVYSGHVAAHGYKLLKGKNIRKVIVISPSHVEYFPFASVFTGDAYETPLGVIPVDKKLAQEITASSPLVEASDRGHVNETSRRQEHALEVQLPFLQCVLKDFTLVPIVMGDQRWDICEALGKALAPLLKDPEVLVVASSDLSHFHTGETDRKLDAAFCNMLEKMDPKGLYEGIEEHTFEACGAGPVIATVIACKAAGASSCRILATANSGDVTQDYSSVVGYASAVILDGKDPVVKSGKEKSTIEAKLSPEERHYLLQLARRSIGEELGTASHAALKPLNSPILDQKRGAFVTIKIKGRLRGCIGYIEAIKPLKITIAEMAKAAAFNDPRFPALTKSEFPGISIEISVLTPLHLISSPEEIEVGRDGLVIEKGMNRGLLLPQVATEYKWNVLQFLEHTCQKAMLPSNAWKDPATKIYAFSAEVFGEEEGGS